MDAQLNGDFLAAWDTCHARGSRPLPDSALQQARRSWFDTAAATIGGARERCTQAAVRSCDALVQAPGSALQSAAPLQPWDEALILGTASHALDFDDVCMLATCHPSTPVISALLALLPAAAAAQPSLRFEQLLSAHIIGTETMLRLGEWLGFRHYALGFHATGTLGAVGAAAACAQLLGLPLAQAHTALSIAASSACGLRANFGTDVKPMHVGFAAAAGVRAVLLARAGAHASDDVWGASGFGLAFNGGEPLQPLQWNAGTPWAVESPGFEHKRFPSCYLTHRLIAGLLKIRARQPDANRATPLSIAVELPKNGLAALKYPAPSTGLEGKFSGHYCAAAAWLDGVVDLASFSDQAVQRSETSGLMARIDIAERSGADERLDQAPVTVRVQGDGWQDSIVVDWAPGSLADPMSGSDLLRKWTDCAHHAGADADAGVVTRLFEAPPHAAAATVLMPLRSMLLAAASNTTKETWHAEPID